MLQLDGSQAPCPDCGGHRRGAVFGKPKTTSGEDRAVDLDGYLVGALVDHRLGQAAPRAELSAAYSDHGWL